MLTGSDTGHDRRSRSGERGSVVLAMLVIMIILLLGTGLVMRSQSQLLAAGSATDAAAAEAGAEQGVAEAVALLDSGQRGDFVGGGPLVNGAYEFAVTESAPGSYVVFAQAKVGETSRAVEVRIEGEAGVGAEEHVLMINTSGSFGDNRWPITGLVGTNGPLDARNSTPPGDRVDLFGPRASCVGCSATTSYPDPRDLPPADIPAGRNCPRNGRFTGVIDGRNGAPFVCSRANVSPSWVTFANNITITNPPLIVHVRAGRDVRFRGATINVGGDPEHFQLYAEGTGDYWWMDAWNSQISGVIYGPGRDSWVGNIEFTGTFTTGAFEIRDGQDVRMSPWSTGTGTGVTSWQVTAWDQVTAR